MKNDICFSFVSVHPKVKLEIGYSFFSLQVGARLHGKSYYS